MQVKKVNKSDSGLTLEKWFAKHFGQLNYSALQKLLRKKLVKVGGKKAEINQKLKEGDEIKFPEFEFKENPKKEKLTPPKDLVKSIKASVIYEDDEIIAINKPWGLPSQGGSGVKYSVDMCMAQINPDYRLVHRLDKDTTGVLVLAKNYEMATVLTQAFKDKTIDKEYRAVLSGVVAKDKLQGKIDLPIIKKTGASEKMVVDKATGKETVTKYKILKTNKKASYVSYKPLTGRTHQLRVHSASYLFPIVADGKYGGRAAFVEHYGKKLLLHSYNIDLSAALGRKLKIIAPLPDYFRDVLGYFK